MQHPLILVMGPLRSGTTLMTQWLANTGLMAYPTNLLSRFFRAPIVGAKIQLLLTDPRFNFRDELGEFAQQAEYLSENGKTKGVLAPNEFWYFWRRFLAEPRRDVWTDAELKKSMDFSTMLAELRGMIEVFNKPFAAKGMLFNYNIPCLNSVIDRVVFVQVKRDPLTNVASALDARRRQLGDERHWYSFDIPEKESLRELEPVAQVAGQIHYINQAIERGLQSVEESRKMTVQYEDFCANPKAVFDTLVHKLGWQDCHYTGAERFDVSRQITPEQSAVIASAVGRFS